jgi:MULE transposase domain/SWIM zinc finger
MSLTRVSLNIGDTFDTIAQAKEAINRFVIDNGESYIKSTSNYREHSIECRHRILKSCSFSIRARYSKKTSLSKITNIRPHTCNPQTHYKFPQASAMWYLLPHHQASVRFNRAITIGQIKANEWERWSNLISYQQAWRVKQAINTTLDGDESECFKRMAALGDRIKDIDPKSNIHIRYKDSRFDYFFCSPRASVKAWQFMRRLIAVDACHCTSQYRMTLFIAVGLDGNGQVVPLAWAIQQGEDYENWKRFFEDLRVTLDHTTRSYNLLNDKEVVIMSDREKGLAKACQEVLPSIPHSYCCQHIAANIQSEFGIKARELFWPMAYARTRAQYEDALAILIQENIKAANYVAKIPPNQYATYAFPRPRYGHLTSNPVESLNGTWLKVRSLQPLRMLVTIWSLVMEQFSERSTRKLVLDGTLTDDAKRGFTRRYDLSRRWRVLQSSDVICQVIDDESSEYVVDFMAATCTCGKLQEYKSPCTHAIIALRYMKKDPYSLFDFRYTIKDYRMLYQRPLPPLLYDGLEVQDNIQPPIIKQQRGRPQKVRIRKRVHNQTRQYRCGNLWCKRLGHNKKKCTYSESDQRPQLSDKSSGLSDAPPSPPSQSDGLSEEDEYLQGLIEEAKAEYIAAEAEGPEAIARLLEIRRLTRTRLEAAVQTIKDKRIAAAAAIIHDKEVADEAERVREEEDNAFWAQEIPIRVARTPEGSLTAIEAPLDSQDETGEVCSQIQAELHAQEVVDVEEWELQGARGAQQAAVMTAMAPARTRRARAASVSQVSLRRSKRAKR